MRFCLIIPILADSVEDAQHGLGPVARVALELGLWPDLVAVDDREERQPTGRVRTEAPEVSARKTMESVPIPEPRDLFRAVKR